MKHIALTFIALSLFGCAQTMTIDESKLGNKKASLKIDASELKGYVSIPLINYKNVNVFLSEFPDCENGEPVKDKSKKLGKATLTPKKNIQALTIPAGSKLLVSSNSHENAGGNMYTCWNAVHFTPKNQGSYVLKVIPHASFSGERCSTKLLEIVDGETVPSKDAVYPIAEYKGFWTGKEFNHCSE